MVLAKPRRFAYPGPLSLSEARDFRPIMSTDRFGAFAGSAAMTIPIALQNLEQVEMILASNPDSEQLAAALETIRETRTLLSSAMRVAGEKSSDA